MGIVAIRASWLFDGTGLQPDPVVLLDGPIVADVGFGVAPPPDAAVVDLPGATLLPGLVDTHVHLCFDASDDPVGHLSALDDDGALAAMAEWGRAALRGGITTVRDLGDRDYLALRLRDTAAPDLPTILAAGPPITTPDGHCHFLGGVAAPGVDGIRAAVREHAARGVDVIKVMASGGTMTPGTRQEDSQFTVDELRAAVDEAHAHGLPITAHAHGTTAIADAVDAGVDGIEHLSFWSADGVDDPPPELLQAIVERRIVVGMTGGLVEVPGAVPPPEVLKRFPKMFANAAVVRAAGARIVVGTDAGIAPVKPPDVLRHALPQLFGTGFTPAQALHTVTAEAADVLRLGERKGRIAPGFDADVLAVDGDPLTDPSAIHRIRAVYARGVAITAQPLSSPAAGPPPASPA